MNRFLFVLVAAFGLTACDYVEVEREVGYKGKARVNPWLAAERYASRRDREVKSVISWTAPEWDDAVWVIPATVLGNESFIRRMEEWVAEGGHLILLVEHADAETNDWSDHSDDPVIEAPLKRMLGDVDIILDTDSKGPDQKRTKIRFQGESFNVDAVSKCSVTRKGRKPGVFASVASGEGRISVLTDGRLFRSRWIGDQDHAAFFDALIHATDYDGAVCFMRGSGLSLWALVRAHLWPVLLGLAVWVALWLWKNFARFGPLEAATPPPVLRGYEHHLEALGDFQWRLDHAASLLVPLREQIVELGQRTSVRAGRRDEDFFQFLADRAGLPRERVFRALAEVAPADPAILTRTTADLQQLLQVLHSPIRS